MGCGPSCLVAHGNDHKVGLCNFLVTMCHFLEEKLCAGFFMQCVSLRLLFKWVAAFSTRMVLEGG